MATLRETIDRARQALIAGQADAALAPCQEVLARYPKHVEASCLLAETRRELRQLPQAADLFERVIAADPESLIGHWGLATILEERGDVEAAAYELQIAWDVSPGQPAVADELRRVRGLLGWPNEHVDFSSAGLARVYWRGHHYRRALAEAHRALAAAPERLDLSVLECEALWRLGRVGEAAEVAAEILLEAPDCLKANLIRGYARIGAGPRAAEEGRKLLARSLALDPECVVAATLFPDRELALPLIRAEVDLADEPRAMTVEEPREERPRASLLSVVTPEPVVAAIEPTTSLLPLGEGQEEGATLDPEPEPEHALTLALSQGEREPTPEPEPVPAWLAKDAAPALGEAGGLDPELYAEWADLLGEEVELDAESAARLEAALAEATGGSAASGGWREVVLDRTALADSESAPLASSPAAEPPAAIAAPLHAEDELPAALDRARASAAGGDLDAAGEAYRALLRAHADSAREVLDELCRLVDGAPDHGGLRRALGDAYMRSGRFQKAIEEYNRAAAVRQPAAVA